jgi:hypothetical protein
MLIVTKVEALAEVTGYWMNGSPTAHGANRTPAEAFRINGKVTGNQLTFPPEGGRLWSLTATLGRGDDFSTTVNRNGQTAYITLEPVWQLIGAENSAAALPKTPLPPSARDSFPSSEFIDVRRFDGSWVADMACAASAEARFAQPLAFARQVFVSITNGVLHGERGPQGKPGSEQWNGTIEPDGSMAIAVSGINGSKARRPNSDFHYQLGGRLEGSQGSAIRAERDCNVKFAKRSAGAGTIVTRSPKDQARDVRQR